MQQLGKEASDYLSRNADQLTDDIIRCQTKAQPDLQERYGEKGFAYYRRDIKYHLEFLGNALNFMSKGLFGSYVEWVRGFLIGLKVPLEDIIINFQCFKRVFESKAPVPIRKILTAFLDAGLLLLDEDAPEMESYLSGDFPLSDLANDYMTSLNCRDSETAKKIIQNAVEEGVDIRDIYLQVLENVQLEIGRLWHANQLTVAQEHYITNWTRRIMDSLQQYIQPSTPLDRSLIACCVAGELHEVGIRMVSDFFELSGWKTYFTGANTPTSDIIHTIKQQKADLLAISVTIPLNIVEVDLLINKIRADHEINDIKIIVGGQAFKLDPQLWKRVQADGYAPDARSALDLATTLFEN